MINKNLYQKETSTLSTLHCFVPLGTVNSFYLDSVIINSKKFLESIASTTTIAYLNKTKCDSLIVALPPLEEPNSDSKRSFGIMDAKCGPRGF